MIRNTQREDDGLARTDEGSQKLLVTEREAARLLSCSSRTLYELRRQGRIPFVRIGASAGIRYRLADLYFWVEQASITNCNKKAAPGPTAHQDAPHQTEGGTYL